MSEWEILANSRTLWRFTTLERVVPVLFALAYTGGFVLAAASS
ncbi:hypothetical protein ACFCV3_11625 [Kribbella sp. NPDC056345]